MGIIKIHRKVILRFPLQRNSWRAIGCDIYQLMDAKKSGSDSGTTKRLWGVGVISFSGMRYQ